MITNPYLPSPAQAQAWNEGFVKGFVSQSSPQPSDQVGPDAVDAFNEGVQAGVQAQSSGLSFTPECVAASDASEDPETLKHVFDGFETLADVGISALRHGAAGALEGGIVSLCLFIILAPVGTQPPEVVLPTLGQPVIDALSAMGVNSFELFCGVGIQAAAKDCEFKITPLFLQKDQAVTAVKGMDRNDWLIVSWRTDQCNSFKILRDV